MENGNLVVFPSGIEMEKIVNKVLNSNHASSLLTDREAFKKYILELSGREYEDTLTGKIVFAYDAYKPVLVAKSINKSEGIVSFLLIKDIIYALFTNEYQTLLDEEPSTPAALEMRADALILLLEEKIML